MKMRKTNSMRTIRRFAAYLVLLTSVAVGACSPNEEVLRSGAPPSPQPTGEVIDTFESDLEDVRRVEFFWLYVIRRRDGDILNSDDKAVIRTATAQANRRVLSDGERAIIVGSNFEVSVAGIDTLKKRFDVTDLSTGKPEATPSAEMNQNK